MPRTSSCLVMTAMAPSAPPKASEPVSPMKILAGGALYHRKPAPPPIMAAQKMASSPAPGTWWICRYWAKTKLPARYEITPKAPAAIITGTVARPSRPSVRFTALEKPTMVKAAKAT